MVNLKRFSSKLGKNEVVWPHIPSNACNKSFLNSASSLTLLGVGLVTIICLLASVDALAMTDDSMKKGLTTLENSLTGSWMRLGLIVGGFIGTVTSFIKQSPIGLVASAGTGLGAVFFTDWVKTAFTATIDLLS